MPGVVSPSAHARRISYGRRRTMQRRSFLLTGGALFAQSVPPSDRITLGVIGSGGRGTFVMGVFQKDPAVRVSAICDVYEPNLERAVSAATKASGVAPKMYRR